MTPSCECAWQVLDVSSIPVEEFASALHTLVPTVGWSRAITSLAPLNPSVEFETRTDPPLNVARFSLQRGFSNALLHRTLRVAERLVAMIKSRTSNLPYSPLVCTSSFYAPVAELWPGPVIYYSTDLTYAYDHLNPRQVLALDRRLCRVSTLVSANSKRIGDYLIERAGCDPKKLVCVPNATRASHVLESLKEGPSDLPADIAALPRPVAGVIGNLAANLDWELLESVIKRAEWLSWVFVGPTSMNIADRCQSRARERVMTRTGGIHFTGAKPYGALKDYTRSFDVGVLPYAKREPTFSGSPTRFYEHLAACRPMLATRGVEQLLHKEPLVRLTDGADEMLHSLEQLRAAHFKDGFEPVRWAVSRKETWLDRAKSMVDALEAIRPLPKPRRRTASSFAGPMGIKQPELQRTESQRAIISCAQCEGKTDK